MTDRQARKHIVDICRRLYERGYIVARSGNVSCRLTDGNILMTPSRYRKHSLKEDDLCIVDLNGEKINSNSSPSSEYRVHCTSYQKRSDAKAIVHAHPPFAIVCSLMTVSFKYPILPETALSLGSIPTVPYHPPGSEELAKAFEPFLPDHNAFVLKRHGAMALGSDLEEAFERLEEIEFAAKIAYHLSIKGRIPVLGRGQLMNIVEFAKEQHFPIPDVAMKLFHRILAK